MLSRASVVLTAAAIVLYAAATAAAAQNARPTYQADPDVYRVIFEDQNFRVIAATWKVGAHDKPHSHPVPSVVYSVTDCVLRVTDADGKTREVNAKAGTSRDVPITVSHSAENIGPAECRSIFVERK
jgi:mannose-6-phosphate isomerase-like protein (cupin superfamily)